MKKRSWILITAALALAIGCATIGKALFKEPKISLDHVSVKDVGAVGATLMFGVKVENPNSFSLRVDSIKYDVEIAGRAFTSGKIEDAASVEGKGVTVVEIPIAVRYTEVFASLLDLVQNEKTSYRVKGEAAFGPLAVPFDEKGEFKFKP